MSNSSINELLYVPYTQEHTVNSDIKSRMNEKEFFEHCFVNPDFDEEIKHIEQLDEEYFSQDDYLFQKSELIEEYITHRDDRERFMSWFKNDGSAVFCITGDAGTGKSTYLHYLKYKYNTIDWCIVDVQRATQTITRMGESYTWLNFEKLSQKINTALFINIAEIIYSYNDDNNLDFKVTANNVEKILRAYALYVKSRYPDKSVANLFEELLKIKRPCGKKSDESYCLKVTKTLYNWINSIYQSKDKNTAENEIFVFLRCYLIFLYCMDTKKKHIIVFDNIERFIGTDEVFNVELVDFIKSLRAFHNSYKEAYPSKDNTDLFAKNFQFLVMMRNTSTRMFIPQQSSDFLGHSMDISDWFPVDKIMQNKISWYNDNGIAISDSKWALQALSDTVCCGNALRGVRIKIDRLFNFNKRLIVEFLIQVTNAPQNKEAMEIAEQYFNINKNLGKSLSKFIYRSIVMRLVLNQLKKDELIKHLCFSVCADRAYSYCEKALAILSNFSLLHEKMVYMPLGDFIKELYIDHDNPIERYFDDNNISERAKLSETLYYMNYYDRRQNNWLQFIDIQYNVNDVEFVKIESSDTLMKIIDKHRNELDIIKLRITNAGKTFLRYIAYSYEFFALRYKSNYRPLVLDIPTKEILDKKDDLTYMEITKHIKTIEEQVQKYISTYEHGNKKIRLIRHEQDRGSTCEDRIFNSQTGYLSNVSECIKRLYSDQPQYAVRINEIIAEFDKTKKEYNKFREIIEDN